MGLFVIPRQMVCQDYVYLKLHGFCDSSLEAYGACLYIKSIRADGFAQVSFVYTKGKVAPLKDITLSRLEWGRLP